MLIDSHCHLDFPELEADLDGVLARAKAAAHVTHVRRVCSVCTGAFLLAAAGLLLREDLPRVVDRAEQHWEWIMRR